MLFFFQASLSKLEGLVNHQQRLEQCQRCLEDLIESGTNALDSFDMETDEQAAIVDHISLLRVRQRTVIIIVIVSFIQ